jgi:hypothetical protein
MFSVVFQEVISEKAPENKGRGPEKAVCGEPLGVTVVI